MATQHLTLSSEETRSGIAFEWLLAVAITVGCGYTLHDLVVRPQGEDVAWWGWALIGFFLLVGVSLLYTTARKTLDRMKHGRLTLRLDGPVRTGGRLSGTLEIGSRQDIAQVELRLACEGTVWAADSYKESATTRSTATLWSTSGTRPVDGLGRVRVDMAVPRDQPLSDFPGSFGAGRTIAVGRQYISWVLHVTGESTSVDLVRAIEIPVLEASLEPGDGSGVIEIGADATGAAADFRLPAARKPAVSLTEPHSPKKNTALRFLLLLLPLVAAIAIVSWQWQPSMHLPQVSLPGWVSTLFPSGRESASVPDAARTVTDSAFEPPKRATLRPSHVIDFDTGVTNRIEGADLWWHFLTRTERQVDARSGAAFAAIPGEEAFRALDERKITALDYAHRSLPVQGPRALAGPGRLFAVRTSEGRFARLRILAIDAAPGDGLQIEWALLRGGVAPATAAASDKSAPVPTPPRDWRSLIDQATAARRAGNTAETRRLADLALIGAQVTGAAGGQLAWAHYRTGVLAWSARDFDVAGDRMQTAASLVDSMPRKKLATEVGADEIQFAAEVYRFLAVIRRDQGRVDDAYAALVKAREAWDPSEPNRYGPGHAVMKLHSILRETSHIECRRRNKPAALKALREAREVALPYPGLAGNVRGVDEEAARIESGKSWCGG